MTADYVTHILHRKILGKDIKYAGRKIMKRKKLGIGLAVIVAPGLMLCVVSGSPRPRPPQNVHSCSAQTTVGRYIVICNGYLSPGPNAPLLPAKLLGNVTADQGGTFTGSSTVMIGGGPAITQNVIGTESLGEDCNGTISYTTTLNGNPGPPLDINFVVSENGDRIDGLVVDPGTVFSCELHRSPRSEHDKD